MNGSPSLDTVVMVSVAFLFCRSIEMLLRHRNRAWSVSLSRWLNKLVPRSSLSDPEPVLPNLNTPATPCLPRAAVEFDTRKARPLLPAVAAEKFAAWMRENGGTDYIWVGELDELYLYFCREENFFPIEAKALRELLYRLPGIYCDRPRLGGAKWERFRRLMSEWHEQRGLAPPQRPVVVRILPAEMVPATRVRDWPGAAHLESGSAAPRGRTAAAGGKKKSQFNPDSRVQPGPITVSANVRPSLREAA